MSATATNPAARALVEHRFVLTCVTRTPLHVGAGEPGAATDAELRRNAGGQYVIPGTSIAGALRTVVERLAGIQERPLPERCLLYRPEFRSGPGSSPDPCGCSVCRLFGDVRPSGTARASRVTVFDAVIKQPHTRVIDGVGISRSRGAAQDGRKYDYRQILPGSPIQIEVVAEQLTDEELAWLGAALRILATGQVGLGGRTSRGHGILKADPAQCQIFRRDLHVADQLLNCVVADATHGRDWGKPLRKTLPEFPGAELGLSHRITVKFDMAPVAHGTFLIADPLQAAATGFDRGQRKLQDKPEIPASSLVGVLRSGAERIVRTIGGRACDPLERRCTPAQEPSVADDNGCCPICRLFGNEDWASRLSATVTSQGASRAMPFDHVAIDRFTGGASDQKKFDALAAMGGVFHVELTADRVHDEETARWIIGLLALVLRDLHDGRLWLGHGGAKG
ncbi:MAG: RAMP superfamily CRISPR-associated protein, partial [Pirellulaceae bacterium]|nr:RAMP superfamily CRISPR-associated protein [Pirellulaceae bacterium]